MIMMFSQQQQLESNGDSQLSAQPDLGAEADVTMVMEIPMLRSRCRS